MRARLSFVVRHLWRVARFPQSPARMAAWVREWMSLDLAEECRRVRIPTLIVTGEPDLDRVVPVSQSLEYLKLIADSRHVTMAKTGHLSFLERPADLAAVTSHFVRDSGARTMRETLRS
jgi:pimeloyl-ACP methyl ester carboxylesterase